MKLYIQLITSYRGSVPREPGLGLSLWSLVGTTASKFITFYIFLKLATATVLYSTTCHDRDNFTYRKVSNIRRTKYQNLQVSRLILWLPLPNPLKPGVKLRMKMKLVQRRQAMLQLHLSDQQFNCLLKYILYYRLDGKFSQYILSIPRWC